MKASFFLLASSAWPAAFAQTQAVPPEIQALDGLLGDWVGNMQMTMPGSSDATSVPTTCLVKSYGVYQETTYTMDVPGVGKFNGHMFLSYDPTLKTYRSWGFDDNAYEPREETGTWDGKKLVMTSKPMGGMVTRTTFEPKSKDTVYFLIEVKSGDSFTKLGDVTYRKKG